MKITVTDNDIRNGITANARQCPVALAIRRVSHDLDVSVGARYVWAGDVKYELPEVAQRFVISFDDGEPVAPLEFDLC